jgi:hypothetical protein
MIVQEPINVMLGSISDLNTVILPINEMFLWFKFFYYGFTFINLLFII